MVDNNGIRRDDSVFDPATADGEGWCDIMYVKSMYRDGTVACYTYDDQGMELLVVDDDGRLRVFKAAELVKS